MQLRNKVIVALLLIGMLGLTYVEAYVKPHVARQEEQYNQDQRDPLTHDFWRAIEFRNKYMGNASNLGNLNSSLPLNDIPKSFELYPRELTAHVYFDLSYQHVGLDIFRRSLVYNITANLVLIDNLETIVFHCGETSYSASREAIRTWYGMDLLSLQDEGHWKIDVQLKLNETSYVDRFLAEVVTISP